jgi:S1-C subfamily serine protease
MGFKSVGRVLWLALALILSGGAKAEQGKMPTNKELEETNVALKIVGFQFGSGIAQKDEKGNPKGDGLERVKVSWSGSGFVVKSDGTIVTNFHVANKALQAQAVFDSGATYPVKFIKAADPVNDVAILAIGANTTFRTARLGDSDKLERLDPVLAVGNTLGQGINFTEGKISQVVKDDFGRPRLIRHTAAIAPGNSGGALYRGAEVIGVNVAVNLSAYGATGFMLAVPVNIAKELLKRDTPYKLEDIFNPELESILKKAKPVQSATGDVPAKVEDKNGVWTAQTEFQGLSDYVVVVKGPDDVHLDIAILRGETLIGYGATTTTPGLEAVGISTENAMPVVIAVLNGSQKPAHFGLTIHKVTW